MNHPHSERLEDYRTTRLPNYETIRLQNYRAIASLLFYCLLPIITVAQPHYTFTDAAERAYEQALQLEMAAATATLKSIQEDDPENLVVHHIANYIDFFQLYLTEDEALYDKRLIYKNLRLSILEELPKESPWRNYALAEIRLQWAMIQLRFESYLPAFRELNKAHKLLRANAKQFPDFLPTYKDLGLLHAGVGSIPPQFKWGVELFSSLQGSIKEGSAEMRLAMEDDQQPFYRETAVLYALLRLHLANEPEQAWQLVQTLGLQPERNKLHCFVYANVAMRNGRNDVAIATLERQPRYVAAEDFAYLDFMLGLAKLRNLDYSAGIHFQSFLLRFNGQHFIREAIQKIAWAELLRGREDRYHERMREIGQKGRDTAGGDKNASNEAAGGQLPHLGLLRARLLFDGAYYERAREEMDSIEASTLNNSQLKLEYYYRTGRILHGLKDYDGALSFYERTISLGSKDPAFYACNAALQAGLVEEIRGNIDRAKHYFKVCLNLSPDEYKLGLHIQAKAGLNRL
ncbi:MAG: hypothetical protein AAF828_03930 [Bacteroidota bacterium]